MTNLERIVALGLSAVTLFLMSFAITLLIWEWYVEKRDKRRSK